MAFSVSPGGGTSAGASSRRGRPHAPLSTAGLMRDHDERDRVRLGTVTLRLNPSSYTDSVDAVHLTVQTAGGYGRYDYGPKPNTYELSGSTGLAGMYGPGGIAELERYRPQEGRRPGPIDLVWAARFRGIRQIYINEWQVTADASSQYTWNFRFMVEEIPQALRRTVVKVPGSVISSPLPIGG